MSAPSWHRIKELFAAAAALPIAQRDDYLREQGADDEMRREVHSLLAAHPPTTSSAAPGQDGLEPLAGDSIGAYKLLENIGEGGFGTVWMAEQREPVQRLVALKLLKAGMDSKQVIARFEQERQALALMQHPHIAQMFDAGTTDRGHPFFVMELVKGVPITDYCEREHLPVRERLDLFLQVCHAVQHAHGKGLIHRDIKPRNVLVATHDGKPHAKVIDFGIAKATGSRLTDKTLFTEHRAMVGTLEYMSPEQAQGLLDIDTRSDIYSLGALLYELLTGATPFDSRQLLEAGLGEILRVLSEVAPQRPSVRVSTSRSAGWASTSSSSESGEVASKALFGVLRGDLDWVVMKALEKDRGRRYASASGLAEDIERYLVGDAVLAVPSSIGYRVRKLATRYRSMVWASAVALAATTAGTSIAVLSWSDQRVAKEREHLARNAERLAKYESALRTGLDLAEAGSRKQAIAVLDGCDPAQREWEWRYARAVADDSLRLAVDQCVAWGTDSAGRQLALVQAEVFTQDNGQWSSDRLCLVDTATGESRRVWEGEPRKHEREDARACSEFARHRLMLLRDGQSIAVAPEEPSVTEPASSGDGRQLGVFDVASRQWIARHPIDATSLVAASEDGVVAAVCNAHGQATCLRLDTGKEAWATTLTAAKPVDIHVSSAEGLVVVLSHATRPECLALHLADGTEAWRSPLEVAWAPRSHMGSAWPNRIVATPREGALALLEWQDLAENPTEPLPMLFLDVADGRSWQGTRECIEMVRAGAGGVAMGMRMRQQMKGMPELVNLAWAQKQQVALLGSEWSFSPRGGQVTALSQRQGDTAFAIGDNDISPGTIDAPLYAGGIHDVCAQTWEWRTEPRRYAGCKRSPLGSSGLCLLEVDRKILVRADRPHDVFPPSPLGVACPVRALGVWKKAPAAIYAGGITTLHCNVAARIPAEDGPFPIDAVAFSARGTHMVTASGSTLRLVATATGEDVCEPIPFAGQVVAVALTPDTQTIAAVLQSAAGTHELRTIAATTGATVAAVALPLPAIAGSHVCISVADTSIAVAGERTPLRLYETKSLRELPLETRVALPATAVQFSPSGESIAVGRQDGRIDILRNDGSLAMTTAALGMATAALAWSRNDARLFTTGLDGFVRIWDPVRGTELLNLGDNCLAGHPGVHAFEGEPRCLFATPDGERLFCGYSDGAVRVWDTVPWSERARTAGPLHATAPAGK